MNLRIEKHNPDDLEVRMPNSPKQYVADRPSTAERPAGPQEPLSAPAPSFENEPGAKEPRAPLVETAAESPARTPPTTTDGPLFDRSVTEDLQSRWNEIQVAFVDEPRTAVQRADSLVEETTKRLADSFAAGRQSLEKEWAEGGEASTESLRLAFQHYRSFFNRLLAI